MENKRQVGASSSSFTLDLFGSKDSSSSSPSSSTDLFASVFGPSSTGLGKDSTYSGVLRSLVKQDGRDQYGNARYGTPDYMGQKNRGETGGIYNKDKNSIYQNETVEPCYFSSSIYYGGQEVYSRSSQATSSQNIFKKVGEDDDPNGSNLSGGASRGNWWEGSLYY